MSGVAWRIAVWCRALTLITMHHTVSLNVCVCVRASVCVRVRACFLSPCPPLSLALSLRCSNGVPEFLCPKGGGSMFTCLDHDDGSDFYLDTRNVCVFAGMKNYLGQNKIWDSNLIAYADGAFAQNRSGMPAVWTSMNMAGNRSLLPCTEVTGPCHNREVFTNNTCISHRFPPAEYGV